MGAGLALDRNMRVLGTSKVREAVDVGELGGHRRGDAAIAGEQYEPVIHAQN